MGYIELFILAVGLSMDAFAVAVCKGLAINKVSIKQCAVVGAWFGIFQALMPVAGYFIGSAFSVCIEKFDHWIAFGLLLIIGGNMIRESFSKEENENDGSLGFKTMLFMALATSIDAFAVGVAPLSFEPVNRMIFSVICIGAITFILSFAGVKIGNIFGEKYKSKAEFAGGLILILLGVKILLEHLRVIGF